MRQERKYDLDDNRCVIIRDMTMAQVIQYLENSNPVPPMKQEYLADCFQFPKGLEFEALHYNEFLDITNIFVDLHPGLLEKKTSPSVSLQPSK